MSDPIIVSGQPPILFVDDPQAPEAAARAVAAGGVLAFPTDTVYGLGADLWQPEAIARLYTVKGRPDEKALPVLLAAEEQWPLVASAAPEAARRLMRAFWPGALTIVLPRRDDVPEAVGPRTRTIAVRVPAHAALCRVLARSGPLASSSANLSGQAPAMSAREALDTLGHGLALVLDGGRLPAGEASTVVDTTGGQPVILRHGALSAEAIAAALRA